MVLSLSAAVTTSLSVAPDSPPSAGPLSTFENRKRPITSGSHFHWLNRSTSPDLHRPVRQSWGQDLPESSAVGPEQTASFPTFPTQPALCPDPRPHRRVQRRGPRPFALSSRGDLAKEAVVPPAGCPRAPEGQTQIRLLSVEVWGKDTAQREGRVSVLLDYFPDATRGSVLRCSQPPAGSGSAGGASPSSLSSSRWSRVSELPRVAPASSAPWSPLSWDGLPQARVMSEPWFSWSAGHAAAGTLTPVSPDSQSTSR